MLTAATRMELATEDLAHIRGITDEWVRASLARDWDALTAMFADDVVFLPPDAPVVLGKAAVRAFLEGYPPIAAFTATVLSAEGQTEFAWARGSFAMTVEPTAGQRISLIGKWAGTYRKRADGGWLCASDTWNLDAPIGT